VQVLDYDMATPALERIVPKGATLEVIASDIQFGEGPVWDKRQGCLFFVDITGDTIYKWTPGKGLEIVMRPSTKADGMTLDAEGRLIVAGWGSRSVWRLNHDGSTTALATHWEGKKLNTPNDIVVKSDGSIWFTDPSGAVFNVGMAGDDIQR
jgi:gluconolactonase